MRTPSRLRTKRRSDTAVPEVRAVDVDGRASIAVLRRSQDSPARKANAANPTATALPADPSFAGRARLFAVGVPPRCATSSLPAPIEAPHEPQKRFSDGLACRHRGHGAWSLMSARPPPSLGLLPTLHQPPSPSLLGH